MSNNIKIAAGHEIRYWKEHKSEPYQRSAKMVEVFNMNDKKVEVVADVGCGPLGGIFYSYQALYMYAVDPLWKLYFKEEIAVIPSGVEVIENEAMFFKLPKLADIIVSVNALDHSGNISSSIKNIMNNLKIGGIFNFHVHLRNRKQLNKAHRMLIKEKNLDDIFSKYEIIYKTVYDICPFSSNAYRSYVASIRKIL